VAVERITLADLAVELNVPARRLLPLISHCYLKTVLRHESLESTIVERPSPEVLDWLKTMFAPLELRPMVPIRDAAALVEKHPKIFRKLCLHYKIPLHDDPVFREIISIESLRKLQLAIYESENPVRIDRQALIVLLAGLKGFTKTEMRPYNARLESEIRRIIKLKEPRRTLMAVDFWKTYIDAEQFVGCMGSLDEETIRAGLRITNLAERVKNGLKSGGYRAGDLDAISKIRRRYQETRREKKRRAILAAELVALPVTGEPSASAS
jgi:hypothetical protein